METNWIIKPNKTESKLINWIQKARSKDIARPLLQKILVKEEYSACADGWRMHMIPTPKCIELNNYPAVLNPDNPAVHADCPNGYTIVDERYPDLDQIMPKAPEVFSIAVNPKFLIDALSGFDGHVILKFYGDKVPMKIEYLSEDDKVQTALIMPVYKGE